MSKDPCALLYIDTWLSSTAEMDADCRGWYINLILHQYDKKGLPSDLEKLAQLAVVKFSEFERFKQVFEQVLKQKFTLCDDGRLRNQRADEVIKGREMFKDKRSKSGSIGVVIKLAKSIGYNEEQIDLLKTDLFSEKVDIEKAKDKQVLKQMLKLYINEDVNEDELTEEISLIKKGVKPKDRIPSLESFIAYGLEKAAANNLNVTRTALSMKYEAWKEAGWVNGNGNEVKNWKASLLNTLPHIVERQNGKPPPPDKDAPVIWTEKDIKDYIENPFISNEAKEAFIQERMRESTNKINIDILTPKKLNA